MYLIKIGSVVFAVLLIIAAGAIAQNQSEQNADEEINQISHSTVATKTNSISSFFEIASAGEMREDTEVTVYNQNLALVKDKRSINLKSGINKVEFVDVAADIDPTSVIFEDLKNPDTFVIEQNYQYDLVSSDKLLDKYLDKTITITDTEGVSYSGKLLSHTGDIVLETDNGIVTLKEVSKVEYPNSAGLLTKPTLVWQVYSPATGKRDILTTYLTGGVNWKANYIIKTDENDTHVNINGWVTVDNQAGTSFENAKLKLVAGDVNRVTKPAYNPYDSEVPFSGYNFAGFYADLDEQISEKSLFEYHLYTLERPTTLKNNEIKQISLLAADDVPIEKEYLFDSSDKVKVILIANNSKENNLGMPLPKGVMRVYKSDSDGQLQFLGEDEIDHTPKNEEVRILVGNAFDIIGERRQSYYKRTGTESERRTYVIEFENHKDEVIEITSVESLRGSWTISESSEEYAKKDASTIEFKVKVTANGKKKITYTVDTRY
jgi:hypothetical protein